MPRDVPKEVTKTVEVPTIIEKPIYIDKLVYVDKPVYIDRPVPMEVPPKDERVSAESPPTMVNRSPIQGSEQRDKEITVPYPYPIEVPVYL